LTTLTLTVGAALADDRTDAAFSRLRGVFDTVQVWHKDGADLDKFVSGAIKGGLEALGDPYTNYFSPKDLQSFMGSLNGTFSGIGAYLDLEGQYVIVSTPIKGTPAFRAGLQSGDRILEVNGVNIVGFTTEKAVPLIRGEVGSSVTLKIERPSEQRTFTVTVKREVISIPEVESKILEPAVGYIQIATFGDDAVTGFYKSVDQLKSQGAKSLVLDLRQNPGGYLDSAVQIASAFIPEGQPVVWELTKGGKTALNSRGLLIGLPVVVLVDNGSASASEILAGAIQDSGAGPLVGVKTFGKGTVQQILNMLDGSGMKVTIAEYLTSKEHHVHGIGLTPDYVVENAKPDLERIKPMEFKRALTTSSVGLDVLYLQYRLQDLGYNVDTDGFYGLKTTDVVKEFEVDNYLPSVPMVDPLFIDTLNQKVAEHAKKAATKDLQLEKALELARAKVH
jgi:carboxyl-terminal processing protease